MPTKKRAKTKAKAKVSKPVKKVSKPAPLSEAAKRQLVTARVSFVWAMSMPPGGKKWLEIDPNDFDRDPSPFYVAVKNSFSLRPPKSKTAAFDGLGGTIGAMIDAIVERWKPPYEVDVEGPLDC